MSPISYLMFWFYILIPVVLYYDAAKHKIGKVAKVSVGMWAVLTQFKLFLILILPIYFFRRKKLIEEAKINPVER